MIRLLLSLFLFAIPTFSEDSFSIEAMSVTNIIAPVAVNSSMLDEATVDVFVAPSKTPEFRVAVASRFDGGIMTHDYEMSMYNVSSLEFHFLSRNIFATVRFSAPMLDVDYTMGLNQMRVGLGLGAILPISDKRNSEGVGMVKSFNVLLATDYIFLQDDINKYKELYNETGISLYRMDMSFRFNDFIHKNLAIVFGIDFGVGFVVGQENQSSDSTQYYENFTRGIYTFGVTMGLMF